MLLVLLTALGTASAGVASFTEAPHPGQLVMLGIASGCAVAYEIINSNKTQPIKEIDDRHRGPQKIQGRHDRLLKKVFESAPAIFQACDS